MIKRLFLVLIFSLVFAIPVLSQSENASTPTFNPQEMEKEARKMQEQMESEKRKHFETLKKENPQMYQDAMRQEELSQQMSKIIEDYFSQKISYENAKSKLYPLIKEGMNTQVDNLDNEIQMLEQRLEELRKAKRNPDYLVYQQIDNMLGKSSNAQKDITIPENTSLQPTAAR